MSTLNHGTYTMYARRKCRCDECKAYQRNRVAKNRAERLATGNLTHGTRSAYDAGCRCMYCKKARSIAASGEKYVLHNHITRDIKPYGQCPGCDEYHVGLR